MGSADSIQLNGLSVVVVGAGIAGLCAAIALRRAGHKVKIVERSALLDEVGAAITLAPNAVKVLRSWGLDFKNAGLIPRLGQTFIDCTALNELHPTDCTDFESNYGAPYLFAHRVDFHAALRHLATGRDGAGIPARLYTSNTVISYDSDAGRVKLTDDSWTTPSDLIIAADGVHSHAAAHILDHDCPAHATNSTVIRFLIPTQDILDDSLTAPLLKYGEGHCSFYLHPDKQRWLVRYPCRDNTLQNFGMYVERPLTESERQGWSQKCDQDDLREAMAGFHPSLLALVEKTGRSILPLWRCVEREPLSNCTKGRLVMIGDASHPMLPHRGFGAINAIEDAAALGVLFENFHPNNNVERPSISDLLGVFESVRLPRASVAQLYSQVETDKDPVRERRQETLKLLREDDLPDIDVGWERLGNAAEVIDWVFGYDVVEATRRAKRDLIERQADGLMVFETSR